jgi:hypothetical protein
VTSGSVLQGSEDMLLIAKGKQKKTLIFLEAVAFVALVEMFNKR